MKTARDRAIRRWRRIVGRLVLIAVALPAFGQFTNLADAANVTWISSSSSAWQTVSNWSTGAVPGTSDTAVFTDSVSAPKTLVYLNNNRTIGGIDFNGATSFDLVGGSAGGTNNLKLNSGTLTATGSATFTLDSTVNMILVTNNAWDIDGTSTVVVNGIISDGGSGYGISKTGTGTLTLTGNNSYSDGTTISAGTLVVGDGTTNGSITGNVTDNGTLEFDRSDNISFAGLITGTGSLTQAGGGSLTLGGATYSLSNVNAINGTLKISSGNVQLSSTGSTALDLNGGNINVVASGNVQVAGATYFNTAQTLFINNATLETDQLTNASGIVGTIQLNDPVSGHALTVGINNGSSTFSGIIQDAAGGTGSVYKTGTGTLTLNGASTYSNGTLIDAGTLSLGNSSALGTGTVTIGGASTTLKFATTGLTVANAINLQTNILSTTVTGSVTESGVITGGTGSELLLKTGSGTLTLTGGTAATPSSFDTLWAKNTTTVAISGAHINLNSSLEAWPGNATIENGSVVQLNSANGGAQADTGTLTVTDPGTSMSGNFMNAGMVAADMGTIVVQNAATVQLNQSMAIGLFGTGYLSVTSGAHLFNTGYTYLGNNNSGAGTTGAATVRDASSQLTSQALELGGSGNVGVGSLSVLSGGDVQVTGDTHFLSSSSSISVQGGTLETDTLSNDPGIFGTVNITDPAGGHALTVGTNNGSSTFNGTIQDLFGVSGSLLKVGTGTFTLAGANTYSGGTTINAGTLIVGDGTTNGSINSTGAVTDNGTLEFNRSDTITFSGAISGTGSLTQAGSGTLLLTNTNAFSGTTTISAGVIQLANANALENSTVNVTVSNGLDITTNSINANLGALQGSGNLNIGSQALTVGSNNATTTYSGVISGAGGSITKTGTGKLTLSNANSFTGGTTITGGTLSLGNSSAAGTGTITVGASSTINYTNNINTVANPINLQANAILNDSSTTTIPAQSGAITETGGSHGITVSGSSGYDLKLTGTNTYTGGTTITGGTLRVGDGTTHGSITGNVTVNSYSALDFHRSDNISLGGNISGTGTVYQIGSGTLTLTSSSSTFSGGLVLLNGTVSLATNSAAGSGAITMGDGSPTTLDYASGISIGNSISLQNLSSPFAPSFLNVSTGSAIQYGGISELYSNSSITKTGSGTLMLAGSNTYTGSTTIAGGTLVLTNSLTNTSRIIVDNSATLQLQPQASIHTATLSLQSGSTLDITTNTVTFDTTITGHDATTLLADLTAAYDKGAWDFPGITSSYAAASHGITTLGWLVSGNNFEIAYTLPGDTDLSGSVDSTDLTNMIDSTGWNDFNYDGKVNTDDWSLFMLGAAYGTPPTISVPEPALPMATLNAISLAAALRRRRRSQASCTLSHAA